MLFPFQKLLTVIFICGLSVSYSQSFDWAYKAGGSSWDDVLAMHMDSNQDILITGMFQNTGTFDTATVTSWSYQDGYVAKYDDLGNIQWVNSMNSYNGQVWGVDVTSDANNNVYVTGYFQGSAIYFTPNDSIEINSGSSRDVFLVKYNSAGVYQWSKSGEGNYSTGRAVVCDAANNVIISGNYNSTITFDGNTAPSTNVGIYMVKYDDQGNLIWLKAGTSTSNCWFTDLAADGSNNIYATGKISNQITFGTQTTYNNLGDDMVTAKFNSSGDLQWMDVVGEAIAVSSTADRFDCGNGIALDQSGNVYVAGSLIDTAYWGTWGSATFQFAAVLKYNNAGSQQWMKTYGNHELDLLNDIALDANGDLYVIGNYHDTLVFGGYQLPVELVDERAFMAKLDASNGDVMWAAAQGTSTAGDMSGIGVAVNPNTDKVYATGAFKNLFNFGSNTLQSGGSWDIYLTLSNDITGIKEVSEYNQLLLYPNPATNQVSLTLDQGDLHDAALFIYNLNGDVVLQNLPVNNATIIELDALTPGSYIVVVQTATNLYQQKLVKM